ncbi:hypothetical protein GQ457_01G018010 [Hibiscus cannabinus]
MIASEEATPTSNSKKQIMIQQTAYPFGLRENGNIYFQQPIRSGSGRMETFIFNSLSVRAQGECKPLFSTAYPFGLRENGNLYFQQQSIRSGSGRMETFIFNNSLSIQAHGE